VDISNRCTTIYYNKLFYLTMDQSALLEANIEKLV
jgi:hypothetical protein